MVLSWSLFHIIQLAMSSTHTGTKFCNSSLHDDRTVYLGVISIQTRTCFSTSETRSDVYVIRVMNENMESYGEEDYIDLLFM